MLQTKTCSNHALKTGIALAYPTRRKQTTPACRGSVDMRRFSRLLHHELTHTRGGAIGSEMVTQMFSLVDHSRSFITYIEYRKRFKEAAFR